MSRSAFFPVPCSHPCFLFSVSCIRYIIVLLFAIVRSIFNHLLVGTPGGVLLPVLQSLFSPCVTYIWFSPLGSGLVEGAWPPSLRGWHCGVPMWCSFIPYDSIPSLRGIYPNHVVHWFCPVHSCFLGTFTGWIHSNQFLGSFCEWNMSSSLG